jgi:two-component system chemotaxis sensor kinase CheA
MGTGVDLSEFYDTFFDEADELLANMEQLLLGLDLSNPDSDDLNGIFRAAHSIKGGAGTFGCFEELAKTTHLLENLLDLIRHGELALRQDMIDLFLETKDVLTDQVAAYRGSEKPDQQAYERICAQLRQLALEHEQGSAPAAAAPVAAAPAPVPAKPASAGAQGNPPVRVRINQIQDKDIEPLCNEMALMGTILHREQQDGHLVLWLETTTAASDLEAVCCFIVNADQVDVAHEALPDATTPPAAPAQVPDAQASAAQPPADTGTTDESSADPHPDLPAGDSGKSTTHKAKKRKRHHSGGCRKGRPDHQSGGRARDHPGHAGANVPVARPSPA